MIFPISEMNLLTLWKIIPCNKYHHIFIIGSGNGALVVIFLTKVVKIFILIISATEDTRKEKNMTRMYEVKFLFNGSFYFGVYRLNFQDILKMNGLKLGS